MKNIILPIDFGDSTEILLNAAISFAKETGSKLHLIHVAPSDMGFAIGDMGFQYFPEVVQAEIQEELIQLNSIEEKVKNAGVSCVHILKQGIAKDIILEYATEQNASYIVMGSHGRSGFYDVFVGSLTKEITKNSTIPVLVIPCHQ
jgi:nucleotide-binding universal stress UspA family protein